MEAPSDDGGMASALQLRRSASVQDCSPSRSGTPNSTASGRLPVVPHKVTKRDTLAGLAIRYNVSVGDIKRVNGLLSDNALYARDTIQIPTAGVPMGEELQLIFAQVATGFGRDPVLNAEANLHPASAAAARVARTLNIINGDSYPPDDPNLPWWCRCGACDEDENRVACRSRQFTDSDEDPGEYELQERTGAGGVLLPPDAAGGPTRMHEHVRRRTARNHEGPDMPGGWQQQGEGYSSLPDGARPRGRPPRPRGPAQPASGGGALQGEGISGVLKQISGLGKALGDMSIIQRIKAAANQPALAGPRKHSFSEAAEGVLGSMQQGPGSAGSSRRNGWQPLGNENAMVPTSHMAGMQGSSSGGAGSHQRRKTGDKND